MKLHPTVLSTWFQGLRTGYDGGLEGIDVPLENNTDELVPYRDLDASRFRTLRERELGLFPLLG